MASFTIQSRNGYTMVTLHGPQETFTLGLRHAEARTPEGLARIISWVIGIAEDPTSGIPFALAESLCDLLEARAAAYVPTPVQRLRDGKDD
jgi:hypothetical protein